MKHAMDGLRITRPFCALCTKEHKDISSTIKSFKFIVSPMATEEAIPRLKISRSMKVSIHIRKCTY
jgi:hypothetical protein